MPPGADVPTEAQRLAPPGDDSPPDLAFAVEAAAVQEYAAVPTLRFTLRVAAPAELPIRAVSLAAQIRIAAERRAYDAATQLRLSGLFGTPERWGTTLRSLLWTHAAAQVPPFVGSTTVELHVPCTYDFEVAGAQYLAALEDGEVPLEFLFSGSVFYAGTGGMLRVARIPWDREAAFRMPARRWREAMDHYFPSSAWLRLRRDAFERLCDFKAGRALATWEDVVAALLDGAGGEA